MQRRLFDLKEKTLQIIARQDFGYIVEQCEQTRFKRMMLPAREIVNRDDLRNVQVLISVQETHQGETTLDYLRMA